MRTEVYAVVSRGIGRRDYSQGIEESVEPLTSSYQESYSDWDFQLVPAGGSITRNFAIPTGRVIVAYDFWASFPQFTLLQLQVLAYRILPAPPVLSQVLITTAYGSIETRVTKGEPFYSGDARFVITNYAANDVWVSFGFAGIAVDEGQYYA